MGEAKRRKMVELPVRLMLRAEGEWWRAYLGAGVGHPERSDGPLLLGQIRMSLAQRPAIRDAFIALMTDTLKVMAADAISSDSRRDSTVRGSRERALGERMMTHDERWSVLMLVAIALAFIQPEVWAAVLQASFGGFSVGIRVNRMMAARRTRVGSA